MAKNIVFRGCFSIINQKLLFRTGRFRTCAISSSCWNHDEVQGKGSYYESQFMSPHVQDLLHRITGFQLDKIFRPKQKYLSKPVYKFMTNEELKEEQSKAKTEAYRRLQIPPFLRREEKVPATLSKDPEIQGLLSHKILCVDISAGKRFTNRTIVVRETNGLLREANREERVRANQVYYPRRQRELDMPEMFHQEHLADVLNRGEYFFVLERACLQFEPDDPEYIRVTETTYKHINKSCQFDILRSTRHFGALAFFLVTERDIDNLLLEMFKKKRIRDAEDLVELYYLVQQPERWTNELQNTHDNIQLLKLYATEESKSRGKLELHIQTLQEMNERQSARS